MHIYAYKNQNKATKFKLYIYIYKTQNILWYEI